MTTTLIEQQFVLDTYANIAKEFSNTRYHVWNFVKEFLKNKQHLYGLDIGCGNGKNMIHDKMMGVDSNEYFVALCEQNNKDVVLADCCNLPFDDKTFDYCICISVIHHLSTEERRALSIFEMIRVLKQGGYGILNIWSQEYQEKRRFVNGDNYVEWKSRDTDKQPLLRYYHIMNHDMFVNMLNQFNQYLHILDIKNEKGNWVVTFVKK
jgi:tRNA (uracil-5-)-methyltransferase TRM9